MPYSLKIAQEAEDDILEAYVWYEKQNPGLGEEFLENLSQVYQAILRNPETYRFRFKKVRAYVVDRFPYLILYILEVNDVKVIAVFNTSRNPKVLKKRIK